jgi:hypothetical protein
MFFIKWIYSFFTTKDNSLPEGEMHGSDEKEITLIDDKHFEDILQKISKYDILGENDYDYIKSLPVIKKAEFSRSCNYNT